MIQVPRRQFLIGSTAVASEANHRDRPTKRDPAAAKTEKDA